MKDSPQKKSPQETPSSWKPILKRIRKLKIKHSEAKKERLDEKEKAAEISLQQGANLWEGRQPFEGRYFIL